jgi:hypothetical protein
LLVLPVVLIATVFFGILLLLARDRVGKRMAFIEPGGATAAAGPNPNPAQSLQPMIAQTLLAAIGDALRGAGADVGEERWKTNALCPWLGWTTVALMRQVPRQQWVVDLAKNRLADQGDSGQVPGLPGWSFEFHGIGCWVGGPEEAIDVDFYGDGGLTIDTFFYANRILGLKRPALPETRLRALLPTANAMKQAISVLLTSGVLAPGPSQNTFRLTAPFQDLVHEASEAEFDQAHWCAHLGDFEALPGHARAAEARSARAAWFRGMLDDPKTAITGVEVLEGVLEPGEFLAVCTRVIDGPLGPAVGTAIKQLDKHLDWPACDAVVRLLGRMVPGRDHPFSMCAAAGYLLRRNIESTRTIKAMLAFAKVPKVTGYNGNPMLGEFTLVALEFAPKHGLELVRASLRSSTPIVRQTVAAALAGLNRPWCRQELVSALPSHSSAGAAPEILAAVMLCGDAEALKFAEQWLKLHPEPSHQGPGYTYEELALANADSWMKHALVRQRDWLDRVGPSIPDNLSDAD